ncbi:hypothetical protein MXB_3257, partial [Myxobolus squamalis]
STRAHRTTCPDASSDFKSTDKIRSTSISAPLKLYEIGDTNAVEIDDRLNDLSSRFTGCVELVQKENENLWNSILEIRESIEKIETQMMDNITEAEDFQNITSSKIQHLENIISQQQQVLTMVDSYFGNLERKWGS